MGCVRRQFNSAHPDTRNIIMVLQNYKSFLDTLISRINALGVDVSKLNLDHIGYQSSSDKEYDRLIPEFCKLGCMVNESLVGGRRVSIFKFPKPLSYKNNNIEAIELIAPKKDQVCNSMLDHAEFVIQESFEDFMKKHPNINWDVGTVNQPKFPLLKINLGDGWVVKFHYETVLEIVTNEK